MRQYAEKCDLVVDAPSSEQMLGSSLQDDRLIKIYIDDATTPVKVPESTLRSASKYFCMALDNEHLGTDERGTLRFPTEDKEMWKILLYWIVKRQISCTVDWYDYSVSTIAEPQHMLPLCRCWIAADKYLMPDLQDKIMRHLLTTYDFKAMSISPIREIFFNTLPGSPLRRLAAEEMACLVEAERSKNLVQELAGAVGLEESMRDPRKTVRANEDVNVDRADQRGELWLEYMVGDEEQEWGDDCYWCGN